MSPLTWAEYSTNPGRQKVKVKRQKCGRALRAKLVIFLHFFTFAFCLFTFTFSWTVSARPSYDEVNF